MSQIRWGQGTARFVMLTDAGNDDESGGVRQRERQSRGHSAPYLTMALLT